jgi:hypothetical protein
MNSPDVNGMKEPLGKEIVSPGPEKYPSIRHPYIQVVQINNGKLDPVTEGTEDGWVKIF